MNIVSLVNDFKADFKEHRVRYGIEIAGIATVALVGMTLIALYLAQTDPSITSLPPIELLPEGVGGFIDRHLLVIGLATVGGSLSVGIATVVVTFCLHRASGNEDSSEKSSQTPLDWETLLDRNRFRQSRLNSIPADPSETEVIDYIFENKADPFERSSMAGVGVEVDSQKVRSALDEILLDQQES